MLVFSKTSFQASRSVPKNPRASTSTTRLAVGWVRGGEVLEFVGQDPTQGAVFYTLSQDDDKPVFERSDSCVSCHASEATHYVPGMFIGSVFPGADGTNDDGPAYTTDHRSAVRDSLGRLVRHRHTSRDAATWAMPLRPIRPISPR
jgi:hypothetical protein